MIFVFTNSPLFGHPYSNSECLTEETMSQSPESVLSFPEICDLLDTLQKLLDKYTSSKMKKRVFYNREATVVRNWVSERELKVKKDSTTLLAFFSLVLPYFRMDRHYFIKEHNLSSVLAKAMGVGPKTVEEFEQWRTTYGDFGLAVENVLKRRVWNLVHRIALTCWQGTQVDCRALSAVQVNESLDTLANRTSFNVTSEKTIGYIIHVTPFPRNPSNCSIAVLRKQNGSLELS